MRTLIIINLKNLGVIMKKILLTAAAATILSTTAFASEDSFYVKANAGWTKFDKVQSLKSKSAWPLGLGVGYNVMDNSRVDLTFDTFLSTKHSKATTKAKGTVNTLLVNGFVDIFDASMAKIFVGAGVGAGMVKAKITGDSVAANNGSVKQKTNLAFAGYLGAATEFSEGVNGELTYSYRVMGKTKKLGAKDYSYKGHNVTAGVRFDI